MANIFRLRINGDYLRFIVKRNRRFIFLMSVAMLTVFPVLYLTALAINPYTSIDGIRMLGQILNLILLILSAFLLPVLLLSYMNKKKDLDVYHALPIKQSDLFITTVLASIILVTIPFMIGWFVGNSLSLTYDFTWVMMLENGLSSLLIAYSISSIVTLALVHVGNSLDGLLYAILLNTLPIIAYLSYNLFRAIIFLGFNQVVSYRIIGLLFPIWSLFENNLESSSRLFESNLLNGVYWLIWSLILYSLSRVVYLNRKHERAESAFTSDYFFPVISSFFMILLIIIMYSTFYSLNLQNQSYYQPVNFIFPFIFSGLVYLVMDTISQRSFKHLYKAMLRYLLIALVGFSLLIAGIFSRSFSFVTRIPDFDSIESVEFKMDDYEQQIFPRDFTYEDYTKDYSSLSIEDLEGIQTVIDFHQIILNEYAWIDYSTRDEYRYSTQQLLNDIESKEGYLSSYENYPYTHDNTYSNISVSIVYHLKGGQSIARQYYVPYVWTKILYQLYESDSILNYVAPSLAYLDEYPVFKQASLREYSNSTPIQIDHIDLNELKEAYNLDMSIWDNDSYLSLQGPTIAILNLQTLNARNQSFESDMILNNLTPNTIAYLSTLTEFPVPADVTTNMYLVLPTSHSDRQIFHKATAYGSWYYGSVEEGSYYEFVSVTPELYAQILPYTTQVGLSDQATYSLVIYEQDFPTINIDAQGNLINHLIKPEYMSIVTELIKDLPIERVNDLYQFNFDEQLTKQ